MLLLLACAAETLSPLREARGGVELLATDRDQDGAYDALDCRPDDAAVHPGAPETCDGRDEDCDGAIDEGAVDAVPSWADADGDGWGSGPMHWTCGGLARRPGDCDDGDPEVSPSAAERCGDGDDDCDGLYDSEDPDLVDGYRSWKDADGDGWGAGTAAVTCSPAEGRVEAGGDCDDADVAVHPGAPEACGGGDTNCDGIDSCPA